MSSNLPPGVSEADIPGNRPEDAANERVLDGPIGDWLAQHATAIDAIDPLLVVAMMQEFLDRQIFCAICETWLGAAVGNRAAVAPGRTVFPGRGAYRSMRYCGPGCRDVDELLGGGS